LKVLYILRSTRSNTLSLKYEISCFIPEKKKHSPNSVISSVAVVERQMRAKCVFIKEINKNYKVKYQETFFDSDIKRWYIINLSDGSGMRR